MADEPDERYDRDDSPTELIPPQDPALAAELSEGGRQLLHCLDCGRQMVARRHGDGCLLCGSRAVVVETVETGG